VPSFVRALSVWKSVVEQRDHWALVLGYAMFGETPTSEIVLGSAIIAAAGLFVIWRERQLATTRRRDDLAAAPPRVATTLRTP
jgi:hypothetical protein